MSTSQPGPESPGETLNIDQDERLCREFDGLLQEGKSPSLELAVGSVAADEQQRVFQKLLAIEVGYRRTEAQTVSRDHYLGRFPDFEPEINQVFNPSSYQDTRRADQGLASVSILPGTIGRFEIVRQLGAGGFGQVFLAHDPQLNREVAIKVMRAGLSQRDEILSEARNAAGLSHETIVTVFDVSTDTDQPFIVQEYVVGESLAEKLDNGARFTIAEAVKLIAEMAEGLAVAHKQRIFHRDIKPGNILIEPGGTPRLIDFGLALHERDRQRHRGEVAGSLSYMSPEQFRGESHRIDDRSDIWSLSVVFYRLLTGRLPFDGATGLISEEVQFFDPVSPRQIDPAIPEQIERIVLRGLSKRMVDRYAACIDMIGDLRHAVADDESIGLPGAGENGAAVGAAMQSGSLSIQGSTHVVPRGLLSFQGADAEFYPTLLPGPFDRDGMPTAISFWLDRLTSVDPLETVPVGIIYGQSGCGKSSLVRAGILPRLSGNVIPVYADCTDTGTEERIVEAVDLKCGDSAGDLDIMKRFVAIRESTRRKSDHKVLIVLDQFEQWLHGRTNIPQERLTLALRQCDGVHLQVLLVVRDDFWLGVSRFLRAIEIPITEALNAMPVEPFGKRHAKEVLKRFGIAYGAIPQAVDEQTEEQDQFLEIAIEDLSDGTHVTCVTLSLFAHMFKDQEWTASALGQVGGTDAVGVRYLQRVFDGSSGPLALRRYAEPAKQILDMLLPSHGANIKGHTRSRQELQAGTGLEDAELDELLQLLDKELSLVAVSDTNETQETARRFRLAHDYMVAPIRGWRTRQRRSSRRGRAILDLQEAASRWEEQRISGLLPSFGDYIRFQTLVPRSRRRPLDDQYLSAWGQHNYLRMLGGVVLAAIVLVAGNSYRQRVAARAVFAQKLEELGRIETGFLTSANAIIDSGVSDREIEQASYSDNPRVRIRAWLLRMELPDARLESKDVRQAVDYFADCDALEGRNLVRLLSGTETASTLEVLQDAYDATDNVDHRSRFATARLLLGDIAAAGELVQPGVNPTFRSQVTGYTADWVSDWAAMPELIGDGTIAAPLRSALADSVTLAWPRTGDDRRALHVALLRLLETDCSEPTLVSSVSHALEMTGSYSMPAGTTPTRGDDWFVNTIGIRLLRIQSDSLGPDVFLADREVSNSLLNQYLAEPKTPKFERHSAIRSESPEMPAQMVSLELAMQFCNWLSRREKLPECYEQTEGDWELVSGANGYRIPTLPELECAAQGIAGPQFLWHCMNTADAEILTRYEVLRSQGLASPDVLWDSRGVSSLPVGSRLPNSLGFHDTLGSVSEWVWKRDPSDRERFTIYGYGAGTGLYRSAESRARVLYSASRSARSATNSLVGFRVAITKPSNVSSATQP